MPKNNEEITTLRAITGITSFIIPGFGQFLLKRFDIAVLHFCIFLICFPIGIAIILSGFEEMPLVLSLLIGLLFVIGPNLYSAYNAAHK